MNTKEKVFSLAAVGVLVSLGVAYAATLGTTGANNVPGNLSIDGGALSVGVANTTAGTLTVEGGDEVWSTIKLDGGYGGRPDWWIKDSHGHFWVTGNNPYPESSFNVKSTLTDGVVAFVLHKGDLTVKDGDASLDNGHLYVDNGDINVGNGDLNIAGGVKFDGSGATVDASVTATSGGDVVIQLGN